jgi:ZIP family zinc transporter
MQALPIWATLLVGLATGAATLVGGVLILYVGSAFDLILAFSAGAVIGVAVFDLLPEGLELAGASHSPLVITAAVAGGLLFYLTAARASTARRRGQSGRRHLAPASLTVHSFVDGLAIGLAFHVAPSAAFTVAIGVLAHDFIDGANTVTLSLSSGSSIPTARAWLAADAAAPLAGILVAEAIDVPGIVLSVLLGLFSGFFLYIGASELLLLSVVRRPQLSTVCATGFGMALIFAAISLSNI